MGDPTAPTNSGPLETAGGAGGTNATDMPGGAGGTPEAGSAGSGDVPNPIIDDTAAFAPNVPNTYDGAIADPGLEVIAHTLREGPFGYEWLVAVRNTGTILDPICSIDIESTFFDATGVEIASGFTLLDHPLYRGCSGTCGFVPCLSAGEIGMASDEVALLNLDDPSRIASVTHNFGALLIFDAVPSNDLTVSNIALVDDGFGGYEYTGQLNNGAASLVDNPSVAIFGVNAVGRPLFKVTDSDSTPILAGSSWSFTTLYFEAMPSDYVVYVDGTID